VRPGRDGVQVGNAHDHASKSRGNLRVGGIGVELGISGLKRVNRGMEGRFHLADRAAEGDIGVARRERLDCESVRLEPADESGNIGIRWPVELAELLWSEPLVVVWRGLVLQLGEIAVERRLLFAGA